MLAGLLAVGLLAVGLLAGFAAAGFVALLAGFDDDRSAFGDCLFTPFLFGFSAVGLGDDFPAALDGDLLLTVGGDGLLAPLAAAVLVPALFAGVFFAAADVCKSPLRESAPGFESVFAARFFGERAM